MQDCIKINGIVIRQPDEGMSYNWETTYTEDTTRLQDGRLVETPMFTVEQLGYSVTRISVADAHKIIKQIWGGKRFKLHYFSLYYNKWRDDTFYVGKGSLSIGSLSEDNEYLSSLSFNLVGVNPV